MTLEYGDEVMAAREAAHPDDAGAEGLVSVGGPFRVGSDAEQVRLRPAQVDDLHRID